MATATQTTRKPGDPRRPLILPKTRDRKPSKGPAVCRLALLIGETAYFVRPIRTDIHDRAFSLRKIVEKGKAATEARTVYHVTLGEHGPGCDCPSAVYRDEACKHVRAMLACGLLDGASGR
jgi:hypothetical protein